MGLSQTSPRFILIRDGQQPERIAFPRISYQESTPRSREVFKHCTQGSLKSNHAELHQHIEQTMDCSPALTAECEDTDTPLQGYEVEGNVSISFTANRRLAVSLICSAKARFAQMILGEQMH
jgi:hypothetical protein